MALEGAPPGLAHPGAGGDAVIGEGGADVVDLVTAHHPEQLALLFLGEKLNVRRALATVVGFAGVVITMRPGGEDGFDPWILVALGSALFAAGVSTTIKNLTRTEAPITILVWAYSLMTLLAAGPALYYWRTPTLPELGIVAVIGVFTTLGQSCMVLGLRAGDATAVAPFDYTRLLYATAIGFFAFGEVPTLATFAGSAVIVGSTLYIALQGAKR
jgi:drug/metabolite transporter (DMT)-like permease